MPPPADTLATTLGVESDVGLIWDLPGGHRLRLKGGAVVDFGEVERTTTEGITPFPSRKLGSVLAADEWMLWDGELTIQSALRTDISDKYGATIVPRLGAAWDAPLSYPWRLTLKGGLGRSWRHPSFDELYFDTGLVKGNSELNSEDAWSFDTAIKLSYKRLTFQVAAYHLMIDNLILFLPTTAFTLQATDAQGARTTGIENRLTYHPFTSLYFDLRYTYMNARFRDSGMQLPGRSPHVYGARVRFRKKGLLLWFAMEGQSAFFMDRFEGIEEESRILYDLGVTASAGPYVSFGVVLKNLTDVRTSVDAMQQPLPGLSVLGNVRIKH
ncbi:MAG TPA: TonB-dependent receptor [Myxococcales bacterium]|nr:TonB-dependent receptor [Myxococcales bacterium]